MAPQTLASRVDSLEQRVTRLDELPAHVDALTMQVSQLRDEMRAEFSAVRLKIKAGDSRVMEQVRVLHEDIVARLTLIQEGGSASGPRRRKK